MVAHPRDPDTAWVIPLTPPEEGRLMPDGQAAVWRTSDAGASWVRGDAGLPAARRLCRRPARGDGPRPLEPVGVYFGTSTGQLFGSADEGVTWTEVAATLPPIWSVEAIVV